MQDQNITKVNSDELKDAILCCFDARRPVFVWGNPGIGKSQVIAQVAEDENRELLDVRASQWDAVDTRGVPYVEDKSTRWAVPGLFPTDGSTHVLLFDELNTAAPAVQAALYQLILDRRLGEYVLPKGVDIAAAGNLETDRAVTHRMPTPLASRFVHLQLVVDTKAWMRWAERNAIATEIIAYLSWRPKHLHQFDPRSASKAQPDPRGWEYTSDLIESSRLRGVAQGVQAALFTGKLGEAVGTEFCGFLKIMGDLKGWQRVFDEPRKASLYQSSDASVKYALATLIANGMTEANIENALIYLSRLAEDEDGGPEYAVVAVKAAVRDKPELQRTRAYCEWAAKNAGLLI